MKTHPGERIDYWDKRLKELANDVQGTEDIGPFMIALTRGVARCLASSDPGDLALEGVIFDLIRQERDDLVGRHGGEDHLP